MFNDVFTEITNVLPEKSLIFTASGELLEIFLFEKKIKIKIQLFLKK